MPLYLTLLLSLTLLIPLGGYPGAPDWQAWALWCVVGLAAVLIPLPVVLERRSHKPGPMLWLWVGFALARSLAAAQRSDLISLCHLLSAWTAVMAALYAERRPARVRIALRWMAIPLGIVALIQAMPYQQNIFINRNTLGMALIPPLAAWLPDDHRVRGTLLIPLVGILLTLSRGAMISAALMAAWYWSLLPVALPATAAVIPALLAIRNPATLRIHADYWLAGWRGLLESPLIGLGAARLGSADLVGHAHNVILTVASWSGLVGLGLVGWGITRARDGWGMLLRWGRAGVIGLALAGLADDWTLHPLIMAMAGAMMMISAARRKTPQRLPAQSRI